MTLLLQELLLAREYDHLSAQLQPQVCENRSLVLWAALHWHG